ncbi:MAG: cupin domain-containing protein [Renibacterium sp.]|nr:cupin domain-containing protein [Renibacterium sp.]
MEPNTAIRAADVEVVLEDIEPQRLHSASAQDGATELGILGGVEFGIWEMTEGTASDTENDEVFLVISGSATIDFPQERRSLRVGPGDLVRLGAGTRTTWTVHEQLRKLYLTLPDGTPGPIDESGPHD